MVKIGPNYEKTVTRFAGNNYPAAHGKLLQFLFIIELKFEFYSKVPEILR